MGQPPVEVTVSLSLLSATVTTRTARVKGGPPVVHGSGQASERPPGFAAASALVGPLSDRRRQTLAASSPGAVGLCPVVGACWPCSERTASSTFLPSSASTLDQYWNARCSTGSVTPLSR